MIQELLTAGMVDDNKLSIHPSTTTTTSSSSSPHSKITSSSSTMPSEPLRCPRCDSSNTKFCYYNNYNLTQPRHFCKTCRRYWTKGGALRNVPIGGGCRKARAIPTIAAKVAKPPSGDAQIMALLRAAQNPNPNPNLENLGQMQVGLGSSLWRSNGGGQYTCQQLQPLLQRNNSSNSSSSSSMLMGDVPSLGMKWSGNYHNGDQLQAVISNMSGFNSSSAATAAVTTTSAATAASILEQIPLGGGDQFGYWNSALSWSDHLNSANGAFP